MKRTVLIAATAALALTASACSTGSSKTASAGSSTTSSAAAPTSTSAPGASPNAPEVNPSGDIPDNQVFVAFSPPSGGFSVKVPEGWARVEAGGAVTFTDKLNSIQMETTSASAAPTVQSAQQNELPAIKASATNFQAGKVSSVNRKAGAAVLITYSADSPPDPVTGKVVHDAVERYEFWNAGTEVILTLSGPQGADNVDPWRIVTDSFGWQ
ncbi:MAG: hypothetical protein M3066_12975 [Actinomycetota bacterium]|nr:hypothetical protein [Actinomycetota bacterium]